MEAKEPYLIQHGEFQGVLVTASELRENDVLLGRGTGPNGNTGNIRFRLLVKEELSRMENIHGFKTKLAQKVVDIVRKRNGRFLRKLSKKEAKQLLTRKAGRKPFTIPEIYASVPNDVAMEKARQAMRFQSKPDEFMEDVPTTAAKPVKAEQSPLNPLKEERKKPEIYKANPIMDLLKIQETPQKQPDRPVNSDISASDLAMKTTTDKMFRKSSSGIMGLSSFVIHETNRLQPMLSKDINPVLPSDVAPMDTEEYLGENMKSREAFDYQDTQRLLTIASQQNDTNGNRDPNPYVVNSFIAERKTREIGEQTAALVANQNSSHAYTNTMALPNSHILAAGNHCMLPTAPPTSLHKRLEGTSILARSPRKSNTASAGGLGQLMEDFESNDTNYYSPSRLSAVSISDFQFPIFV